MQSIEALSFYMNYMSTKMPNCSQCKIHYGHVYGNTTEINAKDTDRFLYVACAGRGMNGTFTNCLHRTSNPRLNKTKGNDMIWAL